ncbi:hypothetical protein EW026_g7029 [Hermanssonia centrifuga]|uniref:Pre-mRNA-processing protein prp40 n=1 Tax=Hermanssonia centrifuga TaxID=98765 RepID=A0A4S4K975_9APHY|nr:hypothetical protein EW026_g7029 [Hermanssonia centrifuga]
MNIWTEHRNPEGRTYWFNTGTRESVWEKPDDLKTPFERALNQTKWKEYFSGGRKYYYNTDTKESKWDMPDELLLLLEKVEKEGTTSNAVVRTGIPNLSSGSTPLQAPNKWTERCRPYCRTTYRRATFYIFKCIAFEEGEKAFTHLLRKAGVDANWTWDQTMRAIITDPLYKALNTLAEKKAAWQKFTDALRAKEQEEREVRLSKLRPAIRNMLKGNPNVFHYTTFATADRLFAQHPIWQQAKIEAERKLVFEEYVTELKQREMQESRAARARSVSKVVALFKKLEVDVLTRWRSAHSKVLESDEYRNDEELQKLPNLDILLAFEDYSRVREREFEEQMRRQQVEKTRKERKTREAFKDVLRGLVESGRIKARSKWKDVYPSFKDDKRYLDILGNPGSNPLELFWDLVDNLDQKLDAKVAVAEAAIRRHNDNLQPPLSQDATDEKTEKANGNDATAKSFKITPETTKEEFTQILKEDDSEALRKLQAQDLDEVYQTIHDNAVKQHADEKRRTERRQRHLQDDLRYALKKMPDPLDINLTYEEAMPLIQELPEYKALEDEDGRRAAFTKFVKRQKERLREREKEASEDGGSTTSRRRKEPTKDGDRERDRDHGKEHRDRDVDRDSHHERESRSSRHHRGHDDYESHARRSSRDYTKDRDHAKSKDGEKDRDYAYSRSSRHHRDYDREDKRRKSTKEPSRDWDEASSHPPEAPPYREERERSASVYKEDPREKRERSVYDDRLYDDRTEKRPRYDTVEAPPAEAEAPARAETPEEGEI